MAVIWAFVGHLENMVGLWQQSGHLWDMLKSDWMMATNCTYKLDICRTFKNHEGVEGLARVNPYMLHTIQVRLK